jgi:DNA-binding transcriptional LysR family regulator
LVDLALGKMGKKRNIVLRTQHYLSSPLLVATTDLAITVPMTFARFLLDLSPVQVFDLPFDAPELETHLYWHESTDKDQSNQWFRSLVIESAQS